MLHPLTPRLTHNAGLQGNAGLLTHNAGLLPDADADVAETDWINIVAG